MRTVSSKKKRIKRHPISREEFLHGLLRSDFLYYLPLNKKGVVLDVGCGWGTHAFNTARIAGMVYGCDPSEEKIRFCEKRRQKEEVKNVKFIQSKVEDLSFDQNIFDAILVHGLSTWSSEQYSNLLHLYAFLKPGGTLYFGAESILGYIFLKKKYTQLLRETGFVNEPNFYIASPSYHLPRFLIPHQDTEALRFILISMTAYRGIAGALVRFFVRIPGGVSVLRNFFYSYAIFVKK